MRSVITVPVIINIKNIATVIANTDDSITMLFIIAVAIVIINIVTVAITDTIRRTTRRSVTIQNIHAISNAIVISAAIRQVIVITGSIIIGAIVGCPMIGVSYDCRCTE